MAEKKEKCSHVKNGKLNVGKEKINLDSKTVQRFCKGCGKVLKSRLMTKEELLEASQGADQ